MQSLSLMFTILTVLTLGFSVRARVNGQFIDWFDNEMEEIMPPILKENCSEEYSKILSNPNRGGDYLLDCILEYITESKKAEMAIVSVIMGLLPIAIQMIGPRMPDLSALALQRPILALLIAIGSPCPALEHDRTGFEALLLVENEPLWPNFLSQPPLWIQALISMFEYAVVGLAAANSIYLGYMLSFRAIALVSTITGTFGGTPEAFAPLLWVFLSIPVYCLGSWALLLRKPRASQTQSESEKLPFLNQFINQMGTWSKNELTPCAFTVSADQDSTSVKPLSNRIRYILLIINWLIKAGVWIDVIYGVIVFSSILFLTLWDALEIIGKFLGGSVVCRVILAFEMYGLQVVSRMEEEKDGMPTLGEVGSEEILRARVTRSTS